MEFFSYLGSVVRKKAKVGGDVGTRLEKASRVYQMWTKDVFEAEVSVREPSCMSSE